MIHTTSVNSAADRRTKLLDNPWSQAILTGAFTLIPARNYPSWLRQSLIWAPPIIGSVTAGYLSAKPRARRKFLERLGVFDEQPPQGREGERSGREIRALLAGGAGGAVVSVGMVLSLWADEQVERGLQRMKVPFPRAVMAVAVGGLAWWQVNQGQQNH